MRGKRSRLEIINTRKLSDRGSVLLHTQPIRAKSCEQLLIVKLTGTSLGKMGLAWPSAAYPLPSSAISQTCRTCPRHQHKHHKHQEQYIYMWFFYHNFLKKFLVHRQGISLICPTFLYLCSDQSLYGWWWPNLKIIPPTMTWHLTRSGWNYGVELNYT